MDILKEIIKELEQAKIDSVGTYRSGDYRIGLTKAIKIVNHKIVVKSESISGVIKCLHPFRKVVDGDEGAFCTECQKHIGEY
jgi:hypothetical protein